MAVTGIGGFFFRSKDPQGLAAWYLEHLGVGAPEGVYIWNQQAGPTVFTPFENDSDYFAADKQFMLNLRVDDLAALLTSLRAGDGHPGLSRRGLQGVLHDRGQPGNGRTDSHRPAVGHDSSWSSARQRSRRHEPAAQRVLRGEVRGDGRGAQCLLEGQCLVGL